MRPTGGDGAAVFKGARFGRSNSYVISTPFRLEEAGVDGVSHAIATYHPGACLENVCLQPLKFVCLQPCGVLALAELMLADMLQHNVLIPHICTHTQLRASLIAWRSASPPCAWSPVQRRQRTLLP